MRAKLFFCRATLFVVLLLTGLHIYQLAHGPGGVAAGTEQWKKACGSDSWNPAAQTAFHGAAGCVFSYSFHTALASFDEWILLALVILIGLLIPYTAGSA